MKNTLSLLLLCFQSTKECADMFKKYSSVSTVTNFRLASGLSYSDISTSILVETSVVQQDNQWW
jgi:hypothetical protein